MTDKNIYKISETFFVEVTVIGYTYYQGKTTYRVLYQDKLIDVPEEQMLTSFEYLAETTKLLKDTHETRT